MTSASEAIALKAIGLARCVADHAWALGAQPSVVPERPMPDHFGAILADTVLQAGVNYRNVVRPRVERIVREFPNTHVLAGVRRIVSANLVPDYLQWTHPEKISRFVQLVGVLDANDIENTRQLKAWLQSPNHRASLLEVRGIGPKSVDYLAGLLGSDCVAVDRHVRAFANQAGITVTDYELLKLVVSYAADLLGIRRRDFDAWIWNLMSRDLSLRPQG